MRQDIEPFQVRVLLQFSFTFPHRISTRGERTKVDWEVGRVTGRSDDLFKWERPRIVSS